MKKSPVITAALLSAEGVAAAIMIFCGKYAFNEDSLYFVLTAFLVVPYVSAAASFVAFVYRSRFYAVIPFFSLTLFAFLPLAVFSDFYSVYFLSAVSGCAIGAAAGSIVRRLFKCGNSARDINDCKIRKEKRKDFNESPSTRHEERKFTGA